MLFDIIKLMKKCYDFGVWYVLVGLDEFKLSYWSFLNEFGYKKGWWTKIHKAIMGEEVWRT